MLQLRYDLIELRQYSVGYYIDTQLKFPVIMTISVAHGRAITEGFDYSHEYTDNSLIMEQVCEIWIRLGICAWAEKWEACMHAFRYYFIIFEGTVIFLSFRTDMSAQTV